MLDSNFRHNIQKLIDYFVIKTNVKKLQPNHITVMAFILGILSAIFLSFGQIVPAIITLWISGLFDVLDGTVARLQNKSSKFGAYLDLVFDRMVEAFVILGFYFFKPENTLMYLLFFIGVLFNFTTFMLAGTLFKNNGKKSMHYDVGLVERTETFITFTLMMIFPKYISIILGAFNILVFFTGIIRMYKIAMYEKKEVKH